METIPYELQSWRGRVIQVPKGYGYFAKNVVDHTITGKGNEITKGMTTALTTNVGILRAFTVLTRETSAIRVHGAPFEYFSKDALRYQDELFLRICINMGENNTSPEGREERMAMNRSLIDVVNELD